MSIAEVIAVWDHACKTTNTNWYLYNETLLCANGYDGFPDTLNHAQIAVMGSDLANIVAHVFPLLPQDWCLQEQAFASQGCPLSFEKNGSTLLEIDVLCDAESQEQVDEFCIIMNKLRTTARRKLKLLMFFKSFFPGFLGALLSRKATQIVDNSTNVLYQYIARTPGDRPYLSDCFTKRQGTLHEKAWFSSMDTISCENMSFPVFSGYREYLSQVYGDYENGLHDEIGCGLTVEDKIALKQHQEHCKEALAFIQQLSEEFGLRYYLLAGSVLGPVRHGGFIPWDDDIDIGIRLEDLAHFEELVEKYLPERLPQGYSLKKAGANSTYPRMFSKICYEGRCCMDLWPLIPTYAEGLRAKIIWQFTKIITKVHYKKIGYKVTRFKKIVKLVDPFLSDNLVMMLARWNERRYINRKTPAYINIYSIYRRRKETILREWLDTEATLDFDGLQVPVVGCTHDYLTHLYGDYMAQPAPWKRASRHVERF